MDSAIEIWEISAMLVDFRWAYLDSDYEQMWVLMIGIRDALFHALWEGWIKDDHQAIVSRADLIQGFENQILAILELKNNRSEFCLRIIDWFQSILRYMTLRNLSPLGTVPLPQKRPHLDIDDPWQVRVQDMIFDARKAVAELLENASNDPKIHYLNLLFIHWMFDSIIFELQSYLHENYPSHVSRVHESTEISIPLLLERTEIVYFRLREILESHIWWRYSATEIDELTQDHIRMSRLIFIIFANQFWNPDYDKLYGAFFVQPPWTTSP